MPESLADKGAYLFTGGQVAQTATPATDYTKITLADVRAGFTDFGEEMIRFMELNGVTELEILTNLAVPRYQKLGYGGAVTGGTLGMKGDVSRWNTVVIRTKENCGMLCFDCVVVCPSEAVRPFKTAKNPMAGGVKIQTDACKGCQLCIEACVKETFWTGRQND